MSDVYDPAERVRVESHVATMEKYREMYAESVNSPAKFWGAIAKQFYWKQEPSEEKFLSYNFNLNDGPINIKWMQDAKTNLCYNCLDRHLPAKKTDVRQSIVCIARILNLP